MFLHEGNTYQNLGVTPSGKMEWGCSVIDCPAVLISGKANNEKITVFYQAEHNHSPKMETLEVVQAACCGDCTHNSRKRSPRRKPDTTEKTLMSDQPNYNKDSAADQGKRKESRSEGRTVSDRREKHRRSYRKKYCYIDRSIDFHEDLESST